MQADEQPTNDSLEGLPPACVEDVLWPGDLSFVVTTYLTRTFVPEWRFSSARALVLREDGHVLVVRDPSSIHVLPGGRLEAGESVEQALRRELAEETGWTLKDLTPLGVLHYHHSRPGPTGLHLPDFLQAVFAARADSFDPQAREVNGYELGSQFMDTAAAMLLHLARRERLLIDAAVVALADSS